MKRPPLETQMYSFATITLILVLVIIISSQVMGQESTPFSLFRQPNRQAGLGNAPQPKNAAGDEYTVETLELSPIESANTDQAPSLPEVELPGLVDPAITPVQYEQIEPVLESSGPAEPTTPAGQTLEPVLDSALEPIPEPVAPVAPLPEISAPATPTEAPTTPAETPAATPTVPAVPADVHVEQLPPIKVPTPSTVPEEIPIPGLNLTQAASETTIPTESVPETAVPDTLVPEARGQMTKPVVSQEASNAGRPTPIMGNPQDWLEEIGRQVHDEVASQGASFAWKKGDFEITPYGILWASMSYENHPSVIGATNFFLQSPSYTGNQCNIDYRGTILGFNIKGPKIGLFPHAKMQGKVEFDLQRTIDYENKATVHLRHCYWEAVSDDWRLLAGQTWDVVSPLRCGTLMYDAGWMDGNVGYRRAQLRLERFWTKSEYAQWVWQGCLSAPFNADSGALLNYDKSNYRVKAGTYPIIQTRLALIIGDRKGPCKPFEIGLSGHLGEMQYGEIGTPDDNMTERTWGLYLDAYVPLTEKFGFQGELFKGENLSMFLGGIGQGVFKNRLDEIEAIDAQGGWMNLWYNLTDKVQWRVGYMIDNPTNDFDHMTTASVKTLNHSLFTSLSYSASKNLQFGLEYNHIQTTYEGRDAGTSKGDRIDFVTMYFF